MPYLTSEQLRRDLAIRDLSDPEQGPHAIQSLIDRTAHALVSAWRCDLRVERGSRVVSVADNYDNLGFEADAVSRDERYTRYVDQQLMLRSHASAIIPSALRMLANDAPLDTLLVCPGIVYRRDSIDRLHTGTPHQMDLWRIASRPLGEGDMDEMISLLVEALTPGMQYRIETRVHPYTVDGRQIDVLWKGEWIEIGECGVANPSVLTTAGLRNHHGLAMGVGLDRLLMLKKAIPDIRLLRSDEPRIAAQMHDLSPYRAVSSMPPIRRDISIATDASDTDEDLGDRVRDALGEDAELVEELSVLSETEYRLLPAVAQERLGITETQKNVLVRIVLRSLDHTITDAEANTLRDRAYVALHQGSTMQWASRPTVNNDG